MFVSVSEHLLWRYADFVFDQDQEKSVKIFKIRLLQQENNSANSSESMNIDVIVNFLQKYQTAHLIFLEYLIFDRKSDIEKYHTQLAMTYLEIIMKPSADDDDNNNQHQRSKFRDFIISSTHIRPTFLLSRLESSDLHQEKAILYGKVKKNIF